MSRETDRDAEASYLAYLNEQLRLHSMTIVDLCTPPSASPHYRRGNGLQSPPDSDVEFIDIQQLQSSQRPDFEIGETHQQSTVRPDSDNLFDELGITPIPQTPSKLKPSAAAPEQMLSSIGGDSSYKCPICLECVQLRTPVATKCGHLFCNFCITKTLNMQRHCPLCKTRISSHELLRIFL